MIQASLITPLLILVISAASAYRLPTIYSPRHYVLGLKLSSEVFTTQNGTSYNGTVQITFTVSENISEVVLHASDEYLNITSINFVSNETTNMYNVSNYSVNSTTDILNISLGTALLAGEEYNLTLTFDGNLSNTDMYGLYKSSYNSSNVTYYLATTQFESTNARRAFPCFDEPKYKATFDVSLTYPEGLNALGNMNGTTTSSNGTSTTVFATTPKMSTYLVAFIVSDFSCSDGDLIEGKLPYQVCSRNETASTREFALEVAPLAIDAFNSYLNINYSSHMNKLHQVAIPDFSAGAMENWGLITYRERALLYHENETTNLVKQYIAEVISHELTHQWFGNLVTCKWWSEIFLNEGFANLFATYISNQIYPEHEMMSQFITKTVHSVFEEDSYTTEALRKNVTTPNQISDRFGGITYDKGASVLRMIHHILGDDVWKAGLNTYLNNFTYSSAEPEDLWEALGSNLTNSSLPAEAQNLSIILKNWIDSPGYPVVNVKINGSVLTLTQERFVFSNTTDRNTTWYVPITYTTSENRTMFYHTTPVAWLTPTESLTLNISSSNISWIVVNNLQTGYYRVNYDTALWTQLASALLQTNYSHIPEINRAQIVNDAFNLARAGYINYTTLFSITEFLYYETSYHVWYSALNGFEYLVARYDQNSTLGAAIANHVIELLFNFTATVPISKTNASNHMYTLSQGLAQTTACKHGNSNCTSTVLSLFEQYRNTSVRPDKNIRHIVYCYGLKYSSSQSSDWEFLWNAYLNTSLATEKSNILSALGCADNATILNLYLQKTLIDNSGIRSQDYAAVFAAVHRNGLIGVDTALDFFISNFSVILSRFNSWGGVGGILKAIAQRLTTNAQIIKLQKFVSSGVLNGTLLEAGNAALKTAQNNQNWASTYRSSLLSYYGIEDTTDGTNTNTSTTESSTTGAANQACFSFGFALVGLLLSLLH